MTAAPRSFFSVSVPVSAAHQKHGDKRLLNLAKSNNDFRAASRREDANALRRAFGGHTQREISLKASRALGVSERQVVYWLQEQNDMPSWAVKAVLHYVAGVEAVARRIEGRE